VWAIASRRLANAQPAPDKKYAGQAFEIYVFGRDKGTVLVAWIPEVPDDTRPDKRAVVTLKWPDGASARLSDMLGRALPDNYLQRQEEGNYNVVVDVDPIFIELNAAPDSIGW
ncbi:MAG: hypothetical protein ACOC29_00715, partial [Candidatus Sumerlaeota bacterium]